MIRRQRRERADRAGPRHSASPARPAALLGPRPSAKAWHGMMLAPVVCLNFACFAEGNSPPPEARGNVGLFFASAVSRIAGDGGRTRNTVTIYHRQACTRL